MSTTHSRRSFLGFAAAGAAAVLAGGLLAPTAVAAPTGTPTADPTPSTAAAPETPAAEVTPLNVKGALNEPGTLVADLGVELSGLPTDKEFEIRVFEHGYSTYAAQTFQGAPKGWMTTSFAPPAGGWKPGKYYGVWVETTDGALLWKANFTPSKAAVREGHSPRDNRGNKNKGAQDNKGGLAKTGV
ncbi:hypothetical protein AADG42_01525 [Ammonicoccus fulvus]|uniref:Secreted protein n=1 Tax=Ammonicoccus fulvus TaxID=3138240 RepID=A0ABZ3FLT9_9ACTN